MSKVIIIGGGAAGMMAAAIASKNGNNVVLLEKNEKLGKKVYITGKGRCNITNACEPENFFRNVTSNPKFLYSSIYGFTPYDTIEYFEGIGLETKIERGNRVFPASDKSSDVIRALQNEIKRNGVEICLNTNVSDIVAKDGCFSYAVTDKGDRIYGDKCFVATGGLSYPSTGSTGDGYKFASKFGHRVTRLLPSLVAIKVNENYVKQIEGLSLKNVVLTANVNSKVKYSAFGEMIFTHDGISGPLVLTLSSDMADELASGKQIDLRIDLKPGLDKDKLDARVVKDFEDQMNKCFENSLNKLLPSSLVPVVVNLSGIEPDKRVNEVTKVEREALVNLIKSFPLTAIRAGGYNEAVVTKGGVTVKEINPGTMESKIISNLYFIGEVLDLDAYTGGYNLQIAWATAYAAANNLDY